MSHRVVVDAAGVTWELWAVEPTLVEHRSGTADSPPTTGERRRARSPRLRLSPAMMGGWLAIRSDTERRRVAPIPPGWDQFDDAHLLLLVQGAESVGATRRLIE